MNNIQEIKQRFGIIGNTPSLNRAIEKAMMVAPTDISVLVTGESGVGKEIIPKVIHNLSARKHGPYIAVNCGAIPEGTIESELFGHEKGAFTGAAASRKGYFEVADTGTIFLDEVGELPLTTQVRLLRVLESGEFMKVGSSATQKTNVRVVAATNLDMAEAIRRGRFREDLYYRLNTVEISLPPLRGRKEDIYLLFRKFAADFAEKYRIPPVRLTEDAVDFIETYSWPGNIRQLRNFTEQISVIEANKYVDARAVATYLHEDNAKTTNLPATSNRRNLLPEDYTAAIIAELRGEITELKKVVGELLKNQGTPSQSTINTITEKEGVANRLFTPVGTNPQRALIPSPGAASLHGNSLPAYRPDSFTENPSDSQTIDIEAYDEDGQEADADILSLSKNEQEIIRRALARHAGRRKDAAEELGISERTLYRKIKQYNIQ